MERLVRHNLSGGLLGKSLWTRSDLEQYHKGNKQQKNFLSTPYGGLKRRNPSTSVGVIPSELITVTDDGTLSAIVANAGTGIDITIDSADGVRVGDTITISGTSGYDGDHVVTGIPIDTTFECTGSTYGADETVAATWDSDRDISFYPSDVRGFPFVYSATAKYQIMLVNYTADGEDDINRMLAYDDSGTLKDTVSVPYAQSYFFEISKHHVNDVMTFAHQEYPPARIVRYGDTDWRYETLQLTGGPLLDVNTNRGVEASISADIWDVATTYSEGDIIQLSTGNSISITGASWSFWYTKVPRTYYTLRVVVASGHGYVQGDEVTISALTGAAPDNYDFSGTYAVVRSGATYIDVNTGRYVSEVPDGAGGYVTTWYNDYALPVSFVGSEIVGGSGVGFYQSLSDSNTGNTPSATSAYWQRTYSGFLVSLKSNTDIFSSNDVGRKFDITGTWSNIISGQFVQSGADQISDIIPASGVVQVKTTGIWGSPLRLLYSQDNGISWEKIAEVNGDQGDSNHSFSRTLPFTDSLIRLESDGWVSFAGETSCNYTITVEDASVTMDITEYTSSREVLAQIESPTKYAFTSFKWSFGAFGGDQKYPSSVTVHEERLTLGGTAGRPFMLFGSQVNDWTNFALGTLETSPIIIRLNSDNVTQINWLLSRDSKLFIGTDFGEYGAETPDKDTVISGTNPPRIKLYTTYGSDAQQALAVHDQVIHVMANRKTVRGIQEREYTTTFTSKDLTIFSPTITGGGLRAIVLQRNPYTVIWGVTDEGLLVSFTYDVENAVIGWAEHELSEGLVKSHWMLPDSNGEDIVHAVVEREDTSVGASGTCSPDVTGVYGITATNTAMRVQSAGTTAVNGFYIQNGTLFLRPKFEMQGSTYYIYNEGVWGFFDGASSRPYISQLSGDLPSTDSDDWSVYTSGTAPVPTMSFLDLYVVSGGAYFIGPGSVSGYSFYRASDGAELFESATFFGTYTPVLGSGATGSIAVGELNYHIEKLAPSVTYEDPTGTFESIVELTSLVQGQGVLERDIVNATKAMVYLVESQGGDISLDGGETWSPIIYEDSELYTGMIEVAAKSGNVSDLRVLVRTNGSEAFELTGVGVDVDKQSTRSRR